MQDDTQPPSLQVGYLSKILAGLATLSGSVLLALWLPNADLSTYASHGIVLLLAIAALGLAPLVQALYVRCDELRQRLHQRACVNAVAFTAAASALAGVLQANGWLPFLSQFWTLGLLVITWGVLLMLADRQFR